MPGNLPKRILFAIAMLGICVAALIIRIADLSERPFHCDEANQAVRTGKLLEQGEYRYDPHEHHGPTLYYSALISLRFFGVHTLVESEEWMFRLVPAVFGVGVVALIWALAAGLGRGAALAAGLLTAVSPAMVYYSRYFIQETLFVFFAFSAITAGWRYVRRPSWWAALLSGAGLGLMHATKETCIVLYCAMAVALGGTWFLGRFRGGKVDIPPDPGSKGDANTFAEIRIWHVLVGAGAAAVVSVVLFSSFFTHPRGVLDSILAFTTYFQRAEGAGSAGIHDKPWPYYFQLLAFTYRSAGPKWSEGLILGFGTLGILVALFRRQAPSESVHLQRFFAFYALMASAVFCAIPYKTPWNLLPFYQPWIVMAGVGIAFIFQKMRRWPVRVGAVALLAAGIWNLGQQAYLANFVYAADDRNPYVYAHTSTAIRRLLQRVEDIAELHPRGRALQVNIIQPDADYWPLPWYLRAYPNVGYWATMPDPADAPLIIAPTELYAAVKERLRDVYVEEVHGLRPGVLRLLFVRKDLWDLFMAGRVGANSRSSVD